MEKKLQVKLQIKVYNITYQMAAETVNDWDGWVPYIFFWPSFCISCYMITGWRADHLVLYSQPFAILLIWWQLEQLLDHAVMLPTLCSVCVKGLQDL